MERLADEAGRGIRYGEVALTRAEDVAQLQEVSRDIAIQEEILSELRQMEEELPSPRHASFGQRELVLFRHRIRNFRARLIAKSDEIRGKLSNMVDGEGGTT